MFSCIIYTYDAANESFIMSINCFCPSAYRHLPQPVSFLTNNSRWTSKTTPSCHFVIDSS